MNQEKLLQQLFGGYSFHQVLQECSEIYQLSTCRTIFHGKGKEIFYRCKTCQTTPNSCLCIDCFKKGNHEGHEYFIQKTSGGGICDCGNESSIKQNGWCKRHQQRKEKENEQRNYQELIPLPYRETFINEIMIIIKQLVEKMELYKSKTTSFFFRKSIINMYETEIIQYIHILCQCSESDLLFRVIIDLITTTSLHSFLPSSTSSQQTIIEYLVLMCFSENKIIAEEISLFILQIMTIKQNRELLYSSFLKTYILNHQNPSLLRSLSTDVINTIICQLTSEKELNEKYFFSDESLVLTSIEIIRTFISNVHTYSLDDILLEKMAYFIGELETMIELSPYILFEKKIYRNHFLQLIEDLTFFNKEYRLMKEHRMYENENDIKIQFLVEEVMTIGYRCIDSLSEEEEKIKEIIEELYERYQKKEREMIVTEEIDVGRNQPVSKYYLLLTFLEYSLTKIKNIEQSKLIEKVQSIILYPLIYFQFLSEMSFNEKLWIRNGSSVLYKMDTVISTHSTQLMNDIYLFQLSLHSKSNKPKQFMKHILSICKVNDLFLKKQERIDEQISGMICALRLIFNIVVDPIYSCQLTSEEIIKYILFHILIQEKYSMNEVYSLIPVIFMRMMNYNVDGIVKELVQIHSNKYHLKEKYKKYINPYTFYLPFNEIQFIEEKLGEIRFQRHEIFKGKRRSNEMNQQIMKFLHSKVVSQLLLTALQLCENQQQESFIPLMVSHIIKLRIWYPTVKKYSDIHQQLLEMIGKTIETHQKKDLILNEFIHLSSHSKEQIQFDLFGKKLNEIIQSEMKKQSNGIKEKEEIEKRKRKQEMIKRKMNAKSKILLTKHQEEHLLEEEEKESCIICQREKKEQENPLGYLCHIEMSDALGINQLYENDIKIRGRYENGKWIKPYYIESNELVKKKKQEEYRILSFCPHKIHFNCYCEQHEQQMTEENYYLKNILYCPLCHTLSSVFIEEKSISLISFQSIPSIEQSINEMSQLNERMIEEYIERMKKELGKTREMKNELTKSEERTLENILTRTIRIETITSPLIEIAFTSVMNVIISTLMTLEMERRESLNERYKTTIIILNSLVSLAYKIKEYIRKEKREEMIDQCMKIDLTISPKQKLIQILQCSILSPNSLSFILYQSYVYQFLRCYSLLSQYDISNSLDIIVQEMNERSQSYFIQLEILLQILSQSYISTFTDQITMKFTSSNILQLKEIVETTFFYTKKNISLLSSTNILPSISIPFHMITLPETYRELIETIHSLHCSVCGIEGKKIIQNSVLCLSCGSFLCYYDRKRENTLIHSKKPVFEHQQICSGEVGIFLIIETASLLIITPQYHSIIRDIYLNEFGETPKQMMISRGEYYLNKRLLTKIEKLYLTGQISSSPELSFTVPLYH